MFILAWVTTSLAQLANSNFGLRSKMGITLNHEYSEGAFTDHENDYRLAQNMTNFQLSFPVILKVDTTSPKVRLSILKAEYTFRNIENDYFKSPAPEQQLLIEDFYANSVSLSYIQSIGYPWMIANSLRLTLAGDYGSNNPININASSFILRRFSEKLTVGVGALYQQMEDEIGFLVVPYIDLRISDHWFVDVTAPDRILLGKNIGKDKKTQLAWGTYIEFFTRFAFREEGQNKLYQNFEVATGVDFRTPIRGKLYFNAFVGNNVYKDIRIRDNELNDLERISTSAGLNARIGISLNLQD